MVRSPGPITSGGSTPYDEKQFAIGLPEKNRTRLSNDGHCRSLPALTSIPLPGPADLTRPPLCELCTPRSANYALGSGRSLCHSPLALMATAATGSTKSP
jgi:hypothetical protein